MRYKIAQYIKSVRKKYRLSQKEFAGMIGVNRATFANYESARTEIPGSILLKIQDIEKRLDND